MGLKSVDELFEGIPGNLRLKRLLQTPPAMAETEALSYFRQMAETNETPATGKRMASFLGAGAYYHFIPTVIDTLISRSEFYTSYTPYQPEISQGTLQAIFEFQSMICELTGMDVSNASLYDGSTATAEAVLMAERVTGRTKVALAGNMHPEYIEVVDTYIRNAGISKVSLPFDAATGGIRPEALSGLNEEIGAVIVQSPNFFGGIEELQRIGDAAHRLEPSSWWWWPRRSVSECSRHPAGLGQTLSAAKLSPLAFQYRTVDRTVDFSPRARSTSARYPDGWSEWPTTSEAVPASY